jgi:hypothetical protein
MCSFTGENHSCPSPRSLYETGLLFKTFVNLIFSNAQMGCKEHTGQVMSYLLISPSLVFGCAIFCCAASCDEIDDN